VAYVSETCVRVHCGWIVYPPAVSLLTALFLVMVLVQTEIKNRDGFARGWKSSLLPLVYHGIKIERDGTVVRRIDDMKEAAKRDLGSIEAAKCFD